MREEKFSESSLHTHTHTRRTRLDDDEGRWITTENGHKIHINEQGQADKGNPHVTKEFIKESAKKVDSMTREEFSAFESSVYQHVSQAPEDIPEIFENIPEEGGYRSYLANEAIGQTSDNNAILMLRKYTEPKGFEVESFNDGGIEYSIREVDGNYTLYADNEPVADGSYDFVQHKLMDESEAYAEEYGDDEEEDW